MSETGPLGGQLLDRPRRFGDFTLLRRIATGGTAEIFLARRHGLEGFVRHLAIKRVLPHLADNPDFVQLILDEARLAAHLHHGHIIEIHQVGVQSDQAYIAMEYLPGLDLGRLIKSARRRGRRAVIALDDPGLARAVADGLRGLGLAVGVAADAAAVAAVAAEGAMDLLILQSRGLAPTRDPLLAALQAAHPELLRTVLVGPTGGRGFGTYSVVAQAPDPAAIIERCRAALRLALPPEITVQVVRAVVDALDYAHTARDFAGRPLEVVHRDINPSNVLVSINGSVKLVDFGIARATTTLRQEVRGNLVGTYAYMSPEQATGAAADPRSDLFSVGTLLYELLAGVHPFAGENEFATLRAIREADCAPLEPLQPGLPADLPEIALRALRCAPGERYPTARAMLTDLEGLIRREGIDLNPKRLAGFLAVIHGDDGVDAFGVTRTGYAPQPPLDPEPGSARSATLAVDAEEPTDLRPVRAVEPADRLARGGSPVLLTPPTSVRRTPLGLWLLSIALAGLAGTGWWLYLRLAAEVARGS